MSIRQVGIYRVNGSAVDMGRLKRAFESNPYEAEQLLKECDIHAVAGILKQYLRYTLSTESIGGTILILSFSEICLNAFSQAKRTRNFLKLTRSKTQNSGPAPTSTSSHSFPRTPARPASSS